MHNSNFLVLFIYNVSSPLESSSTYQDKSFSLSKSLGWPVQRVGILMACGSGCSVYEMESLDGAPKFEWLTG
jgi:hypothetical protein